ncbi:MAG TPA: isopentenyl phosphate kinase [Thermoplasmata archaeon]|nr:isopentenyl phosphate kinase [Thermoplasmata archaeon]
MTEPTVVVKLGGSVITRKRGPARIRPKVVRRLAAECAVEGPPRVVLHGAGSFGHPGAVRWGLAVEPGSKSGDRRRRARGASIVAAEVRDLHAHVLSALIDAGVSPMSVPMMPSAVNDRGELAEFTERPFERALGSGLVPVAFGDVVPDTSWGFSILSADRIAVELVRRLRAARLIFVSDIDGVHAHWPPQSDDFVRELTASVLPSLPARSANPDVTGGIAGKVRAMLAAAEGGAEAVLISGLKVGELARAIRGESVYGSWARPGPA